MTIDEAITNLECLEQSQEAGLEDDEKAAIKLGIEALKAVKLCHNGVSASVYMLLPGETPGETKD